MPEGAPGWAKQHRFREQVQRVARQIRRWYSQAGRTPPAAPHRPALASSAEQVKGALMQLTPEDDPGWGRTLSKQPAFWNRIALQHLRAYGVRRPFLVVYSLDGWHRELVLAVPPPELSESELLEHASRQATFHDDQYGRFQPGLRVRDQLVLDVPPAEREFAEQYLWGYPLALLQQPHAYNRGNYSSYDIEHGLRSVADLDRQLQLGYIEGPLHYAPRIINPQGGVYLAHKDKYRPVLDCSVSGLNGLLAPQECKYDMFEDMLARVHPDDSQSGFDLKDAFYNWPRVQRECDLLGLQGPPGRAGYYRYRFTSMGLADSPSLQQRWMRIIQGMMNSELSTLCQQQRSTRPHSGRDAEVAATFVDDAHALHPVEYNDTEKQQQFDLLIDFLQRYNIVDSPAKREPPQNPKVYVGLEADAHTP